MTDSRIHPIPGFTDDRFPRAAIEIPTCSTDPAANFPISFLPNRDAPKSVAGCAWSHFPLKMAFGILSVLVPLFIVEELSGDLMAVGVALASFNLATIPASILFGYFSDTIGKRKIFCQWPFLLISLLIFITSLTKEVTQFILLYTLLAVAFSAWQPALNMLIIEHSRPSEWDESVGYYQWVTGIGSALGLGVGVFLAPAFGLRMLILLTGFLCLLTFISSLLAVQEPASKMKREEVIIRKAGLSLIERATHRRSTIHHHPNLIGFFKRTRKLLKFNIAVFDMGVLLFITASVTTFAPLPVFFLKNLSFSHGVLFALFFANALMSAISYPIAGKLAERYTDDRVMEVTSASRITLFPLLMLCMLFPEQALVLSLVILMLFGFTWALFTVSSIALSLKLAPKAEKAESSGVYLAVTGLASVIGAFLGGLLPTYYGYELTFLTSGVLVLVSYLLFVIVKQPRVR